MIVIWSPTARAHLRQAQAFIAEDNPRAAAIMAKKILTAVDRLIDFPASGRLGTPFFLPYRVKGQAVEILGVIHGARKWPLD